MRPGKDIADTNQRSDLPQTRVSNPMSSEEPFRRMVDSIKDYAIFLLDRSGNVSSWNQGAERIKGYKSDEIIGRHFSCFYTLEDLQARKPDRELEIAAEKGSYEEESWRVRKDGSRFLANVVLTALKDDQGNLRGFAKVTRDVSESRRVEERLHESEERHRKLFENNPHPTWVFDRETLKFLSVNSAAVRNYGYSQEEFLAMTIKDIRPQEDVRRMIKSVSHEDGKASSGLWRHRRKDGTIINVEITSYSLSFCARPAEVVVAVDVTQRMRDEEEKRQFTERLAVANQQLDLRNREVERATQLKSRFLANMSHELRTPLNAIVGFSDLLADQAAGELNPKQQRFVHHIKQGSAHLLQLINDILDLSKIEAGQLDFRFEDLDIKGALSEVLSIIRPLANAKNIALNDNFKTDVPIRSDRVRFKQILYNLLSNAVKFTPRGGQVIIESYAESGRACVSVLDTGIGIRPEDQTVIFEEFRQLEGSMNTEGGTGLGLAITKRLVEQQGGGIWLESEPGRGSKFTICFPIGERAAIEQTNLRDPTITLDASPVFSPLVLIVDDEVAARELLTSYLAPTYQIAMAESGIEALEKANRLRPQAIILDVLMSKGNGFETLVALRKAAETAHIPVIILSVVDQKQIGFALGAAEYLVKPIPKSVLLETVGKHLLPSTVGSARILLVDDDPESLELFAEILQGEGYRTECVQTGSRALELLSSGAVDALLLDLLMPGMDGFEVIRHVRDNAALRNLPIFVMTGKTLTAEERNLLASQTQALFEKNEPCRTDLILEIGRVLNSDSSVRQPK